MLEIWFFLLTYTLFTSATVVPNLVPGFSFNYNKPGQQLSAPVSQQCETIHVQWSPQTSPGFNATPPFYLHIYTSLYRFPFVINAGAGPTFDWQVPFPPGTLFQICMFDSTGISGSCEAIYTVTQNITVLRPTCDNITVPSNTLDVTVTECGRQLPQFGYISQCSEMVVSPKSGQPPYFLTVSPTMHPPYNMTSDSNKDIVWAATLTPGTLYFMTLSSSDGLQWTNGPMHVGGPGEDWCFADNVNTVSTSKAKNIATAAGIGSAVVGILLGTAITFVWLRKRKKGESESDQPPQYEDPLLPDVPSPAQAHLLPNNLTSSDLSPSSHSLSLPSRIYNQTAQTASSLTRSLTGRRRRERLVVDPFTNASPNLLANANGNANSSSNQLLQPSSSGIQPFRKLSNGEVSATSSESSHESVAGVGTSRNPADLVPLRLNEKR